MATLAAKAGRQPVDFKALSSSLIHSPSTLARRATRKAIMALEVHSRRPYRHAPRPRLGAPRRLWRPSLGNDHRVFRVEHRGLYGVHLPWPWERPVRPPWLGIIQVTNPILRIRSITHYYVCNKPSMRRTEVARRGARQGEPPVCGSSTREDTRGADCGRVGMAEGRPMRAV